MNKTTISLRIEPDLDKRLDEVVANAGVYGGNKSMFLEEMIRNLVLKNIVISMGAFMKMLDDGTFYKACKIYHEAHYDVRRDREIGLSAIDKMLMKKKGKG